MFEDSFVDSKVEVILNDTREEFVRWILGAAIEYNAFLLVIKFYLQIHSLCDYADIYQVTPSRTSQAYFLIPFERDLQFIGRDDIITEVDRRLETKRRVALAGIGGVG